VSEGSAPTPNVESSWLRLIALNTLAYPAGTLGAPGAFGALGAGAAAVFCGMAVPLGPLGVRLAAA